MIHYKTSARVTLYANRVIMVLVVLLSLAFPWLLKFCQQYMRPLPEPRRTIAAVGYYACAVVIMVALWQMDRLLKNVLREQLFVHENVNIVRRIRWCCMAVSLLSLLAVPLFPYLVIISLIMGFLCLVVTVVGQMLKAAVTIREENDLTV